MGEFQKESFLKEKQKELKKMKAQLLKLNTQQFS